MLTLQDLLKLQKMISDTFDEKLKQFYEDHIKYLPTKEEYFQRMDNLSGEIQKVRDEQILHTGDHDRIDQRVSRVEKKLNLPPIAD